MAQGLSPPSSCWPSPTPGLSVQDPISAPSLPSPDGRQLPVFGSPPFHVQQHPMDRDWQVLVHQPQCPEGAGDQYSRGKMWKDGAEEESVHLLDAVGISVGSSVGQQNTTLPPHSGSRKTKQRNCLILTGFIFPRSGKTISSRNAASSSGALQFCTVSPLVLFNGLHNSLLHWGQSPNRALIQTQSPLSSPIHMPLTQSVNKLYLMMD